ncbi:MAG TPA: glycosyltransferase family 4 protein [Pyrinomonadaceae bacterium]|nr:glycosyltransferase family 4 protein [Pyrinomonadaceae bacterium]
MPVNLHIGFVTTESPYGDRSACGIAAYLRALVPALANAGHRVTVFANSKDAKTFYAEAGMVAVHHFPLTSFHWYAAQVPGLKRVAPLPLRQLEWSAGFYRHVARVAAATGIDVLEATESGALFLNRIAPLVIRLHGSEYSFRKHAGIPLDLSVRWNDLLEGKSASRAVAVTTPSQFQADEIINRRQWPADRVRVIPNPVSGEILKAAQRFVRNGASEQVVLYTGRLAPVKGIETLLQAARLVHDHNPKINFVLAGPWQMPGPPEAYGLQLDRQTVDGVRWIGPQDQSELINWYKRASLFVMPSCYESFGISAVEAMAFGLPVVASDSGALPELIGKHGAGSLVPKLDPEALAEAILSSFSGANDKSAGTPATVERFHPDRVAAATADLYQQVREEDQRAKRNWSLPRKVNEESRASAKARVLILSNSYLPVVGGVQTVAHNLARELFASGHQVRVVTNRYPRSLPAKETIEGIEVDRILFIRPDFSYLRRGRPDLFAASLVNAPLTYAKLKNLLREFRPDVVNVHFPDHQIPFVLKLRSEFAFRLVVSLHGHDIDRLDAMRTSAKENTTGLAKSQKQLKSLLKEADVITACSRHLLDKAVKIQPSVSRKGCVLYNGVDLARFANKTRYSHPRPYILSFGRLTHKKGFDLLLRAFAQAGDSNPAVDLIIAGEGEDRERLRVLVNELELAGRVHFFGDALPTEIVELLNGCVFAVVPSRHEPFGIVALEAIAAGKHVLATRTGGLGEFLSEKFSNGATLVEPTVEALTDGLRQLLAAGTNGSAMAMMNGSVLEQYSWPLVAKRYENILIGGGLSKAGLTI